MNYKKAILYAIPILVGGFVIFRLAFAQNGKSKAKPSPEVEEDNFPLKKGSRGSRVQELQNAILKRDPNALPKYGADSDFGSETENALVKLTGKNIVENQSELDKIKSGSVVVSNDFPLKKGSRGAKVKELQMKLLKKDPAILPKYGADSDFGSETETALVKLTGKNVVNSQAELDAIN
jgi:hypothetical protein